MLFIVFCYKKLKLWMYYYAYEQANSLEMGNCFSHSLPQDAPCTQITDTCTSSSLGGVEAEMAEVFLRVHIEATLENQKNMRYDEYRRCWVENIVAGADGGVGDGATCADASACCYGAVGACWCCWCMLGYCLC